MAMHSLIMNGRRSPVSWANGVWQQNVMTARNPTQTINMERTLIVITNVTTRSIFVSCNCKTSCLLKYRDNSRELEQSGLCVLEKTGGATEWVNNRHCSGKKKLLSALHDQTMCTSSSNWNIFHTIQLAHSTWICLNFSLRLTSVIITAVPDMRRQVRSIRPAG